MKINLPNLRTREGIKTVTRFIVARATSICVVTVINQNVDSDELRAHNRAGVFIGAHVIGEMVADATAPFVDKTIDEYADAIADMKAERDRIINAPS